MTRYAAKTLRKLPPAAREIARLSNELASVQTRLYNRIDALADMERLERASHRVFCSNPDHAVLVAAAVRWMKDQHDPEAVRSLVLAVMPLDPAMLFEQTEQTSEAQGNEHAVRAE